MPFELDPQELHSFPDRLFRRELQVPANLRELIEDLDRELAARLDFDRVQLLKREHIFEDWRHFQRDLPFLIPYRGHPRRQLMLCLLLEHQSQADRAMPLRMRVNGSMFWENEWKAWAAGRRKAGPLKLTPIVPIVFHTGLTRWRHPRPLANWSVVRKNCGRWRRSGPQKDPPNSTSVVPRTTAYVRGTAPTNRRHPRSTGDGILNPNWLSPKDGQGPFFSFPCEHKHSHACLCPQPTRLRANEPPLQARQPAMRERSCRCIRR